MRMRMWPTLVIGLFGLGCGAPPSTPEPSSTPLEQTSTPERTEAPTQVPTGTPPEPETSTPQTPTPELPETPTSSPGPTSTASPTPLAPTDAPTAVPTATPTPFPDVTPVVTPTLAPEPTPTPLPTGTPLPTATPVPPTPTLAPTPTLLPDGDQDAYSTAQDCNDQDPDIHPGAPERCNGLDDDCDSQVDEALQLAWYADVDQDGFGDPDAATLSCSPPVGAVSNDQDCDDQDDTISPEGIELCNEIDDNCDGNVDEEVETAFHPDSDGDGYGDPMGDILYACAAPVGTVADASDCDDTRAEVHPDALETCTDPEDLSCDGMILYVNADGDAFAACVDCDDTDPDVNPDALEVCDADDVDEDCSGQADDLDDAVDPSTQTDWYLDSDDDTFGQPGTPLLACDDPSSEATFYVENDSDCDDGRSSVYPNAPETCDLLDNDCDGTPDEGVQSTFYVDGDGDTFGDVTQPRQACQAPVGAVANSTDCDDTQASIYPGAPERCNHVDDDCDLQADEGLPTSLYYPDGDADGYGDASAPGTADCLPIPGTSTTADDCDDGQNQVHPGMTESCNGVDDNCSSGIDEGVTNTYYQDSDGDGYGNASSQTQACTRPSGYQVNALDCNDANVGVNPAAQEVCDAQNQDENCSGAADDSDPSVQTSTRTQWYPDADRDGYGDKTSSGVSACDNPSTSTQSYVADHTDCNDANQAIKPSATEAANGIDDNCNGQIDEGAVPRSCAEIKVNNPAAKDGLFTLDPDGATGATAAFPAYCDMTVDGGGWTLVASVPNGSTGDHRNQGAVGVLTAPFQGTTAKLSDATINLLRGSSYTASIMRQWMLDGKKDYFRESRAFNALGYTNSINQVYDTYTSALNLSGVCSGQYNTTYHTGLVGWTCYDYMIYADNPGMRDQTYQSGTVWVKSL